MKKSIFTVSLLICLVLGSQMVYATNYGVKAGVNFAKVTDVDSTFDSKARTGLAFGVFAELNLSETLMLQPEVLYSQKGIVDGSGSIDGTWKFDYLDIPVLVKYYFSKSEGINPYVIAGPYFAFKLSSKFELGDFDMDYDDLKGLDFGLTFGLGAQFGKFLAEARYSMGIAKAIEEADSKNSVFSLMVGYRF